MRLRLFPACSMRPFQGSLDFPFAAKQLRRLFEPRSGVARQDILPATDFDIESEKEDLPYEAWAAYRKAKNTRRGPPQKSRSEVRGANKV